MYRALLALALCLSCAGPVTTVAREKRNPVPFDVPMATLMLEVHCLDEAGDEIIVHGTGVAVSPRLVVTADHVATCIFQGIPISILATDRYGREASMVLLESAKGDIDAAVLMSNAKHDFTYVPIAKSIGYGEVCIYSANPGPSWRYDCGEFVGWRKGKGWAGEGSFTYRGFFVSGSSGSGIFNDKWELVGVHVGGNVYDGYGIGYAVEHFSHLLK